MKKMNKIKTVLLACACALSIGMSNNAAAEQSNTSAPVDILPAKNLNTGAPTYNQTNDTHPPLKMTPDKSELVRLERGAGSIIIGAPAHLSVLADSAKTLVLVPKLPGATYVTILDKKGNILMQRHVIIGSPKEKYVRIRKSCTADQEGCQPTQVYYCPDMCHAVSIAQEDSNSKSSDSGDNGGDNAGPQPVEDNSSTEGN